MELTRRTLIVAAGAAGVARCSCHSGTQDDGGTDAGSNQPPVWSALPPITFTLGVPGTFSVARFVTDPDGDPLTLALEGMALPNGVTFDAVSKAFVYDGSGAEQQTTGHVLTADDGK